MAICGLVEEATCIGEPLSLAAGVVDILDGAVFGQQESFVGVFESKLAESFNEVRKVDPRRGDSVAALVPVVGISGDDVDPVIAWIPRVGSSAIVVEDLESEVGRHPGATKCFYALIV